MKINETVLKQLNSLSQLLEIDKRFILKAYKISTDNKEFKQYLLEMARYNKTDIRNKSISNGKQIFKHLFKVFYFRYNRDTLKHLRDVNNWFNQIQKIKLSTKQKYLPSNKYYEYIYQSNNTCDNIKKLTDEFDRYNEPDYIRSNINIEEIKNIIDDIIKNVSSDLSMGLYGNIINYINLDLIQK